MLVSVCFLSLPTSPKPYTHINALLTLYIIQVQEQFNTHTRSPQKVIKTSWRLHKCLQTAVPSSLSVYLMWSIWRGSAISTPPGLLLGAAFYFLSCLGGSNTIIYIIYGIVLENVKGIPNYQTSDFLSVLSVNNALFCFDHRELLFNTNLSNHQIKLCFMDRLKGFT